MSKGTICIFTGNGKGKTTAALGRAVRAAVDNQKVTIVQFLKGNGYTGELFSSEILKPLITIKQFGYRCPISAQIRSGESVCNKCGLCFRENRNPANAFAIDALAYAKAIISDGDSDLVILDEISHAIKHKLISLEDVCEVLLKRPSHVDIILTGRNMPQELANLANDVTECCAIKHPLANGLDARRGTEY